MADDSTYGGSSPGIMAGGNSDFGSALPIGGGADASAAPGPGADVPPAPVQQQPQAARPAFGSAINKFTGAPSYDPPDPKTDALDQSANLLQQRVKRASEISSNPLLQIFQPEGVAKAREMVPQLTEQLLQIQKQKQIGEDNKNTARNMGLTNPSQFGPATTNETLANEALRQWKDEGNFNAYKGLQGLSPEWAARANLYVPEAMSKFGQHVNGVSKGMDTLNAGADINEAAYKAARDNVIKGNDLSAIGVKEGDIPKTREEWLAKRPQLQMQYSQAKRTLDQFTAQQDRLGQAVPVTDEKVAKQIQGTYQFGNGEEVPGFKAVSLPGYGDVQGVMGPPGSKDTTNRGVTWSNAAPEQVKTVREQLNADEVKGAISKYKMSRDFYNTANNDKLYKSAAGLALISDELGAIGRDVAEGSKAAGSIGLTKMLEAKYGTLDNARNALERERNALRSWVSSTGDGKNPRLSAPSIQGIKDVANFKHEEAMKEVRDRINQPMETAGRYGMQLKNMGLDKELTESPELRSTYDNALRRGNQEIDSYPMVTIGDRRVMLPSGSNVPGAKIVPLDHGSDTPGAAPPGPSPVSPTPGATAGAPPPGATPPAPQPGGGTNTNVPAPQRFNVAGQDIDVPLPPGVSPRYVNAMQRIESGGEKDPWKAGNSTGNSASGASGAFQFTKATWADSKPAGAPDRARDATPQQQAEALANLTQKNANALNEAGVPVNDTNIYIAHNLGAGGAKQLLNADPKADARTVMGRSPVDNTFFYGRPTVAQVLERYQAKMDKGSQAPDDGSPQPRPGAGGATASLLSRVGNTLAKGLLPTGAAQSLYESVPDSTRQQIKDTATEHAPAIGSTVGAVAGAGAGGPVGAVAGGAVGGGAGQALKDYLQGNEQDPQKIAKEFALGGVLGIAPEGRPIVGAAARVLGSGAVEGADTAAKGGDAVDAGEAALKGGAFAAGGEMFGRALGMVGHKVWNLFTGDAKTAVRDAAKTYSEAQQVLETESPKLPGVNGAAGGVNPKYEAAEKASAQAEKTLQDAGLKPEEAAYAHKVSSEGVPKQEAQAARPGALEQERLGKGYQKLEQAVGDKGIGAPKAAPKLTDGPISAVENKQVPKAFGELAEKVEMAITAPAKNWQEKWVDLKDARHELLKAERAALDSTSDRKTETAKAYRTLADTVRKQQEKVAKYVFSEQDGEKFMSWMKTLDVRYRNLMDATNGGDLAKAAAMKGEAGRAAERKFMAFAAHDPAAQSAYKAMRQTADPEKTVPWTVVLEGIPVVKHFKMAVLASMLREASLRKAAADPATFDKMLPELEKNFAAGRQTASDIGGAAGSRAATMGGTNEQSRPFDERGATERPQSFTDQQTSYTRMATYGGTGVYSGGDYDNFRRSDNIEDRRRERYSQNPDVDNPNYKPGDYYKNRNFQDDYDNKIARMLGMDDIRDLSATQREKAREAISEAAKTIRQMRKNGSDLPLPRKGRPYLPAKD